MFCIKAKVLLNKELSSDYFKIVFLTPQIASCAKPGQFVHIRVSDGYEPLLRRPFSIHKVRTKSLEIRAKKRKVKSHIEILYKVSGRGTEILSKKKPGETLDVIGPLGNGFTYPLLRLSDSLLLIGGGIGIAPLLFLAETIKAHQSTRAPEHQNMVLIGTKTKDEILCEKEFKKLGCDVRIATDDGSRGFKGKVTELLKNLLPPATSHQPPVTIYACGPKPMLKIISEILKGYKISCQASLDEFFACGIGACLGCAIKTRNQKPENRDDFEYKLVCKDGPVFNVEDIVWE